MPRHFFLFFFLLCSPSLSPSLSRPLPPQPARHCRPRAPNRCRMGPPLGSRTMPPRGGEARGLRLRWGGRRAAARWGGLRAATPSMRRSSTGIYDGARCRIPEISQGPKKKGTRAISDVNVLAVVGLAASSSHCRASLRSSRERGFRRPTTLTWHPGMWAPQTMSAKTASKTGQGGKMNSFDCWRGRFWS